MKFLSRQDEIIMLVIWRLKDNAYGVTIGLELTGVTGKEWAPGAVYDALYRLERNGLIESRFSAPTSERGGRSKRIFEITGKGMQELYDQKSVQDKIWEGMPDTAKH